MHSRTRPWLNPQWLQLRLCAGCSSCGCIHCYQEAYTKLESGTVMTLMRWQRALFYFFGKKELNERFSRELIHCLLLVIKLFKHVFHKIYLYMQCNPLKRQFSAVRHALNLLKSTFSFLPHRVRNNPSCCTAEPSECCTLISLLISGACCIHWYTN